MNAPRPQSRDPSTPDAQAALLDLRVADALARWRTADALALRRREGHELLSASTPILGYSWDDDEDDPLDGCTITLGVAIVPIEGALMDRAGWWWDDYESIAARVEAMHARDDVRAVMLDVHSPGGMVSGLFDAMRALRAAKAASGKRMAAWVGAGGYSAAYGLMSTCDEIVVSDTAGVGSVGVITSLISLSDSLKREGIDWRVIASGVEKTDGHPAVPISDAAEARLVARINELAEMFAGEIALGRPGTTAAQLLALDGGVRFAAGAVQAGLADRVSTRAALLADLTRVAMSAPAPPRKSATSIAPRGATRKTTMAIEEKLAATLAAVTKTDDPEAQLGALTGLAAKAEAHDAAVARAEKAEGELAEIRATGEARARADALESVLARGLASGQLTRAQCAPAAEGQAPGWARTQTPESLSGFLLTAPVVVPRERFEEPGGKGGLGSSAHAPTRASLVGKTYDEMSNGEKVALEQADKPLFDALRSDRTRRA